LIYLWVGACVGLGISVGVAWPHRGVTSSSDEGPTPRWSCFLASSTSLQRLGRGGEEVDKQLVDAFSLVVMHPVRRVGQALHAVEVGYVVAVGLGQFGAEVGIALPPDDQCRGRDRAKLRGGFLLGLSYRGAVVVDHPGRCSWLRPRLHVAFDFLRRVRRVRVLQEVSEEVPVSGVYHVLG